MKILVVDDMELNRDILEDILSDEGMEVATASDGAEALELLEKNHLEYDAVLLDLVMPKVDGFSVLEEMNRQEWIKRTPAIVISGESDRESEIKSLDMGAADFIRKPFDRHIVIQRVKSMAELYSYKRSLEHRVSAQTKTLQQQYTQLQAQAARIARNNRKIIDILGTVVEFRNLESGEHIKRVKEFTRILAVKMMELYPDSELTREKVELIAAASPLHDIGKITISDAVLLKPGRLTPEEFELMKAHTTNGAEILKSIRGVWDEEYGSLCYDICLYHHERYDGKGYPMGLSGDEIPLSAQLVSIADVYDALVSPRVYKEPFSPETAYEMIMDGQCGVFSPKLLHCFAQAREEFEAQTLVRERFPAADE